MRLAKMVPFAASCLLLASCASGPKFSEAGGSIPPVPAGEGRVYFYRTSLLGAAVQPGIDLNGKHIASCAPGGVSVADAPPGNYEAYVATEIEHKLTFALDPGEEKFIRCYISMGFVVGHGNLELVDPKEARDDIKDLAFTGQTTVIAATSTGAPAATPTQSSTQ